MSCAVGLAPMSLEEILDKCVLHSFSQAWQLGRAIMRTKVLGDTSVTDAVLKQQNGILLLTGKVILAVNVFFIFLFLLQKLYLFFL